MSKEVALRLIKVFHNIAKRSDVHSSWEEDMPRGLEAMEAALAALKPLDWWGEPGLDRLYVMSNRQVMQMKNKSGCVCCIDEEYGDEILSRCDLHKDDRQEATEKMRERCAQTVREWGSDYPGSRLVDAILALEPET